MQNKNDFQTDIVLNVMRASNLLSRIGGKITASVGVHSIQQWMLLNRIANHEGLAIKDLRQDTLVTKQNISSMVERLRQAGYVFTYEDFSDRRITRVKLTEQGHQILTDLTPLTYSTNDQIFEVFSSEELLYFASLVERLVSHLGQNIERKE
ncbi:winged helix-turn-helix transcriptional regulator [Paenibacillus sp. JNUCC31]|uniref:MarR family winged helix-turn-helix transcriptional regulator n=1 Tax=Paenibacillus sp. JNUCC-31 TaxID=2777983 RepID=UPI00177F9806|nr:MarR family winged helix-turn-helix transcriptional regulator [Paenibacillus sp. JNUCC-31]QOS79380.1 winged helix-turn-helix transcriptional regulator [Paenibacillus sp. JNUCC-31]